MPYKFNGKELDEETGLYYYGARYIQPVANIWYGVDSEFEKYPCFGGYCITASNPIVLKDPYGNDITLFGTHKSSVTVKTDLLNCRVSIASFDIDFRGNYTLEGEDILSATLDLVGIADPSGVADGANAILQLKKGEYLDAAISGISLIPYAGDVAKLGKIKKDIKIIEDAIEAVTKVNGNSKVSTKAKHLYEIYDKTTGKVVKTGINGGKISKKGKSYRATRQVNSWNKKTREDRYDSRIVKTIPKGKDARAKILKEEKAHALELRNKGQLDPSLHKRP